MLFDWRAFRSNQMTVDKSLDFTHLRSRPFLRKARASFANLRIEEF